MDRHHWLVRRVAISVVRSGIASDASALAMTSLEDDHDLHLYLHPPRAAGIGLIAGLCPGQDGWQ
jgi:hypothetical protein